MQGSTDSRTQARDLVLGTHYVPKTQSVTMSSKKDKSGVPEADSGGDRFDDTEETVTA